MSRQWRYFLELSSKLIISRSFSLRFSSWRWLRLLRASFTLSRRASAWSLHSTITNSLFAQNTVQQHSSPAPEHRNLCGSHPDPTTSVDFLMSAFNQHFLLAFQWLAPACPILLSLPYKMFIFHGPSYTEQNAKYRSSLFTSFWSISVSSYWIAYLNILALACSAFFLWICSIRTRLFLKTLPLHFMYKSWYLSTTCSHCNNYTCIFCNFVNYITTMITPLYLSIDAFLGFYDSLSRQIATIS